MMPIWSRESSPRRAKNLRSTSETIRKIRFGCLAYTLEMPFKDNANLPDDDFGWNG